MAKQRAKIGQDFFSPTAKPSDDQPDQTQKRQDVKTSKSQDAKTQKSQDAKSKKEQVTIYLSPSTVDEITVAQLKLKRYTGLRGRALSNSALAEAALKIVLNDLKRNEKDSLLAEYLSSTNE